MREGKGESGEWMGGGVGMVLGMKKIEKGRGNGGGGYGGRCDMWLRRIGGKV